VHVDTAVIAAFKPAGMPVQMDPSGDHDLLTWVRTALSDGEVQLVNRIDRPVSGLVLLARDPKALAALNSAMRERRVRKTYWAIVEGVVALPVEGIVLEHRLVHDPHRKRAVIIDLDDGDNSPARTHVQCLKQADKYALVEVRPEGGAFHQIRAQLAAWGHAIRGDVKYGARRGERDRSIALHAHSVQLVHPFSGKDLTFVAPTPTANLWPILLDGLGDH